MMESIAGDIGGTKSWLASVGDTGQVRFEKRYASADFDSAEALLKRFMLEAGTVSPQQVLLALPGALEGQRTRLTNLGWQLDAATMRSAFGGVAVHFVNDFEAAAAGVNTLLDADMVAINPVVPVPGGVRAITGAGTGLGLAYMTLDEAGEYRFHATEGGHVDFAPANAMQLRLWQQLHASYGHVSWERAVSGLAMDDLYRFCCTELGRPAPGQPVDGAMLGQLEAAGDEAARQSLDLFVDLYGAWVGNVALVYRPAGGLYLAGGVTAHLAQRIASPRFMEAALDKGRMRGVVAATPIFLITQERLGLAGAIHLALEN